MDRRSPVPTTEVRHETAKTFILAPMLIALALGSHADPAASPFDPVVIGSIEQSRLFDLGEPLASGNSTAAELRRAMKSLE